MKKVSKRKKLMDKLIKEEVVDIVLGLIHEKHPVTMDEVALRCGVAKGTLYNYFENKNDLLDYVHQSIIQPIKENSDRLFETSISPRKKLHAFVDNVFNFHQTYPLYFNFIQSHRSADEVIRERMNLIIFPLVNVCQEGIRKGLFVDVDPYVMAAMAFGTVVGPMESLPYRKNPVGDMDGLKQDIITVLDRITLKKQEN